MEKQNGSFGLQEVKYVAANNGEFKPKNIDKKPDTAFLYFTILSAYLVVMGGASSLTWPSPVIPKLKSNDTSINPLAEPATTMQLSIMVALPTLVGLSGTLSAPVISDIFGRKKTLQFAAACMVLCDAAIVFSNHMIYIIIARCIFMTCYMGSNSILIIFIVEMCENHNRAKFGCFYGFFYPLGSFYSYLFGPLFNVRIFTLVTGMPLIFWFLFSFFTVETPVYLLSKGRTKESLEALRKLRSNKNNKEIEIDFNEIEFSLKQRKTVKNATTLSILKTKQFQVGFGLGMIPSIINLGCGAPIIVAFLGPIFNFADTGLSGDLVAIIVGVVKICTAFLTAMFVEKFARRTLLLFSTLGCALSQFLIGLYFYLKYINSPIIPFIKLLPVISIIVFFIFSSIGLGPLSSTITSELFTPEFRSVAISLLLTMIGILYFLMTSGFPLLSEYAGVHCNFFLFSLFGFIGAVVLYALLPETSGKSIVEIQEELRNYKFGFKSRDVFKIKC